MNELTNKTVLMVISHPDDEIIFGWPILQNSNIKKKILCCSSDFNNKEREWCKYRKISLFKICDKIGIPIVCLDYNSGFYKLETRQETLSNMLNDVIKNIDKLRPFDFIYTHNFWGEYGHIDHILINQVCMNNFEKIILSDIFLRSNWIPFLNIPEHYNRMFDKPELECKIEKNFYEEIKSIYYNANVWTWSKPAIENCRIKVF